MSALSVIIGKIMSAIVIPLVEGLFIFTGLMFIWGVVNMIMHADEAGAREKGQQHMLWGIIGMAIMVSAYGLVRLIAATIGVSI